MYEALQPMLNDGVELLYSDTDSALLKVPKNRKIENDLPFGNSYREVYTFLLTFFGLFSYVLTLF